MTRSMVMMVCFIGTCFAARDWELKNRARFMSDAELGMANLKQAMR
eukprot:CAMPEP_0169374220 /NCGR_PEP_ID=MMETSP1017-20121227/37419_1 /TAXON_ID=342587 /ORGANISM="Karlodinium micrum, Strain CCMP2283" /LENGTH=45 /DNA_ID= /DNA_START= /DNA_END= /DNA_ORIENTATION=